MIVIVWTDELYTVPLLLVRCISVTQRTIYIAIMISLSSSVSVYLLVVVALLVLITSSQVQVVHAGKKKIKNKQRGGGGGTGGGDGGGGNNIFVVGEESATGTGTGGNKKKQGKNKKHTISEESKRKFKEDNALKEDYIILDETIIEYDTTTNSITLPTIDGVTEISFDDLVPRSSVTTSVGDSNIFDHDVNVCVVDGIPIDCPPPTVFMKYDETTNQIIQVHKDAYNQITQITIIGDDEDGTDDDTDTRNLLQDDEGGKKKKKTTTLQVIGQDDVDENGETIGHVAFVNIPDDAIDTEYLDTHFQYGSTTSDGDEEEEDMRNRRRNRSMLLRSSSSGTASSASATATADNGSVGGTTTTTGSIVNDSNTMSNYNKRRRLLNLKPCQDIREIEVAIAAESSFCAVYNGDWKQAFAKIDSIMADVSLSYEVDGLCLIVKVVYKEIVRICIYENVWFLLCLFDRAVCACFAALFLSELDFPFLSLTSHDFVVIQNTHHHPPYY